MMAVNTSKASNAALIINQSSPGVLTDVLAEAVAAPSAPLAHQVPAAHFDAEVIQLDDDLDVEEAPLER